MNIKFRMISDKGANIAVNSALNKEAGVVLIGTIETGSLSKGDEVGLTNERKGALYKPVKRIEINHEEAVIATSGQGIGICLGGISWEEFLDHFGRN